MIFHRFCLNSKSKREKVIYRILPIKSDKKCVRYINWIYPNFWFYPRNKYSINLGSSSWHFSFSKYRNEIRSNSPKAFNCYDIPFEWPWGDFIFWSILSFIFHIFFLEDQTFHRKGRGQLRFVLVWISPSMFPSFAVMQVEIFCESPTSFSLLKKTNLQFFLFFWSLPF